MSSSVIRFAGRASTLAPLFPRVVITKPAFDSWITNSNELGFAFTLSASAASDSLARVKRERGHDVRGDAN